jgi:WD40-like Beta Propeller Repeat
MPDARSILLALALTASGCGNDGAAPPPITITPAPPPTEQVFTGFAGETPVTLTGFADDAMEPFLSRDGQFLFFNNSNADPARTDLFYAVRQSDRSFAVQGALAGANGASLDAVASLDDAGRFYFISLRDYDAALETIFTGTFADGTVSGAKLISGVSAGVRGRLNFDAEISPDGNVLWFADGSFSGSALPDRAEIVMATRTASGFARAPDSAAMLAWVNTGGLNFAPSISRDGRELFFTRIADRANPLPVIYRAARTDTRSAFDTPQRVAAITGFAEAPSLSDDGRRLYYHKRENGRFVIYLVTR